MGMIQVGVDDEVSLVMAEANNVSSMKMGA